ncbi:protease complex subunit PrcB family protein [Desmospora profundinema]|uniref:PrcB C-terminal domain-containing protein n=1 Tax=Desmospora profundinema TaxID=1571184 RepID=A0ABU1IKH0_9BACL|nr:protease complex subunit PrcB family protein [Desmospora profundinema]MDR6225271.1 hypothetical protein [Desmospora profundinema]
MILRQVKCMMIGVLFLWGVTGCGTPMSDGDGGESGAGGPDLEKDGPVAFQNEREGDLPEPVRAKKEEWEEKPPEKPVHAEVKHDDTLFVVIATPQKPTGGYTIRVNQVVQEDSRVNIHAEEVPPPEDSMVIQALTTPTAVISIQTKEEVDIRLNMKEVETDDDETDSTDEPSTSSLSIQSEQMEQLPSVVKEEVQSLRTRAQGGKTTVHHDGRQFVIIALGERRTGGYYVEVEEVTRQGDEVHVYAREVGPKSGMMVTQALTYPLEVVSFESEREKPVTIHLQRSDSTPNRPDR